MCSEIKTQLCVHFYNTQNIEKCQPATTESKNNLIFYDSTTRWFIKNSGGNKTNKLKQ
jgi:hypothetical protein